MYASPEDVIIRKLQFYKLGGSDKHLRDIRSMLRMNANRIDSTYIEKWAASEGVTEIWQLVRS
jgi:hypothetical protein